MSKDDFLNGAPLKFCSICGLPFHDKQSEEDCRLLHEIEMKEILKEDYEAFTG